jgi:Rrf2 family transcriptional regulator, iron-sulfur cluster assembly transcription factor
LTNYPQSIIPEFFCAITLGTILRAWIFKGLLPSHRNYFYLLVFPLMPLLPYKGLLAIATVVDVALQTEGRPISAKTLARRHCLPPRHLELVLQSLVRSGILKGIRGPHGGYELARDRHGVTASDILCAASTVHEKANSELVAKVVLPFLSVAEQQFGNALSRISLDELLQRTLMATEQVDTRAA